MREATMTRRSFVKAATVAGAAAAIGVSMSGSLVETDQAYATSGSTRTAYRTACHGCIQVCPAIAYVEDGVVVKIEGDPEAVTSKGSLCLKGLNQLHTVYSPRHILHPLKLAGARGSNQWEQISWDEAIELAATKMKESIDKYGNYSLFCSVGGGGAYSFMQAMTFPMALGSPTVFEPGCAQCYLPRYTMAKLVYGGNDQSIADCGCREPFDEYTSATEVLVAWGAQPSTSQVAQSGRGMADLRARGCKTIVVDPNFSPDAVHADIWLPVRPATDGALLLSWFRYIIAHELYDEQFCKYWTNLPFLIDPDTKLPLRAADVVSGYVDPTDDPVYMCYDNLTKSVQPFAYSAPEDAVVDPELFTEVTVNGKSCKTAFQIYKEEAEPWTLAAAEEETSVPADRNEAAIKMYTEAEVAGIANGVALDMTCLASQGPLGCMGLDMIMGYINMPGSTMTQQGTTSLKDYRPYTMVNGFDGMFNGMYGIGRVIGWSDAQNAAFQATQNATVRDYHLQLMIDRLGMGNYKGLYEWCHSHIPTVLNAITTGEPYKPRCWFDMSGNKLVVLGNASSWYNAFPEIDFIIGQYPMLTSFHIEAADLVFPLEEWLEFNESQNVIQNNWNYMRTQVIHLGETVSNGIPCQHVIEKMAALGATGITPAFLISGEHTEEEKRQSMVSTFKAKSYDDLVENASDYIKACATPDEEYWIFNQHEHICAADGLPQGFGTESRKCEPYCVQMLYMSRNGWPFTYPREQVASEDGDYSPICQHIEPPESPKTDTEYPLALTSGRVPYFHHGTMRHAAFARELYPAPDVRINPQTAAKYGVEHMDWVWVRSRRGEIRGRAYLTQGVAPGMVWMERFWNPECFDSSQKSIDGGWSEMNVNVLTKNSYPFNECFGSYNNRGITVQIAKADSGPSNCWIEPEEFKPFLPTLESEPQMGDVF
jgi:anaerobic selenocysteine-containing dehydrogenase